MDDRTFSGCVRAMLHKMGYTLQNLAHELHLHPSVLGRKLRGTKGARLTQLETTSLLLILVDWRVITARSEMLALLELAQLKPSSFSEEAWQTQPLSDLVSDEVVSQTNVSETLVATPLVTYSLPSPQTRLIGRERDMQRIQQMFRGDDVHLVTLTGVGGSGKTRLALEVASAMQQEEHLVVCWVPLVSVHVSELVPHSILQSLGLVPSINLLPLQQLCKYLQDKHLLLILDNFEQVSSAAQMVGELLSVAPHLKVLVTSREVLHLYGEYEYRLSSLDVPNLTDPLRQNDWSQYSAIQLFAERVQAVLPNFVLTNENKAVIVQITFRLDGLPLSLELAAARMKLFSPEALLQQLETSRLSLLTGGARNLHIKQQTLRNTLQWSYDLLDEREQRFFRQLTVFEGGFTLTDAEGVCATQDWAYSMIEGVSSLLDKNLVQRMTAGTEQESRFLMLETIREYGLDRLRACGEEEAIKNDHAHHYLLMAEKTVPLLFGAVQATWMTKLRDEYANLLAATQWLLEQRNGVEALRMVGTLGWFWCMGGESVSVALSLFQRAMDIADEIPSAIRAKALLVAGMLTSSRDENARADSYCRESLRLYRALGDSSGIGTALRTLGFLAWVRDDYDTSRTMREEALQLLRSIGDVYGIADTLTGLMLSIMVQGEFEQACSMGEEAVRLMRQIENFPGLVASLVWLALTIAYAGRLDEARNLLEEALTIAREGEYTSNIVSVLVMLGLIILHQSEVEEAQVLLEEGLSIAQALDHSLYIALSQGGLGLIAAVQGSLDIAFKQVRLVLEASKGINKTIKAIYAMSLARFMAVRGYAKGAVLLFGTLDAFYQANSAVMPPFGHTLQAFVMTEARTQLGEQKCHEIWLRGRTMKFEQALVLLALDMKDRSLSFS